MQELSNKKMPYQMDFALKEYINRKLLLIFKIYAYFNANIIK